MRRAIDEGLAKDVELHVVHLGDTSYSGWPSEYTKRFLPYWPVDPDEADRIGSWSLNYYESLDDGLERWARMGFAVLDFDGPSVEVRYIDELGATHHTEQTRW